MFSSLWAKPFGGANLLVSRHVFIFMGEAVRGGEPPGEPACIYIILTIRIWNQRLVIYML